MSNQGEASPDRRTGSRAIERALGVLAVLKDAPAAGLPLSVLASRLDLPLSTTHRLTVALLRAGYVDQDEHTDLYRLGAEIISLGRVAERLAGAAIVNADLERLVDRTRESATLAIRSNTSIIVIARVETTEALRTHDVLGRGSRIHATANGKLLLALAPNSDELIERLGKLEPVTPNTITDPDRLRAEMEMIRQRGFAVNIEEMNVGVAAVAVPVYGRDGTAAAALSLDGPRTRLPIPVDPDDELLKIMRATAADLSRLY